MAGGVGGAEADAPGGLCPVDFSDPSRRALHEAADLARAFDADLTLLHVHEVPGCTLPEGVIIPGPAELADLFERVERTLGEWKGDAAAHGAPHVDTLSTQGIPWHEVVTRAQKGRYDLVVVGTHGHTDLKYLFLGSVAERVVRHSAVPVLTIRGPDQAGRQT